jgi:uncharacterized membrane protein YfcA
MWKNWAEVCFVVLLLIGFFVSIAMPNPWINYFIIFLAGLLAGRWIYKKKGRQPLFPFFLIIVGFLFGYMLGAYPLARVNAKVIAILFIVGVIIGYYIHKKGYIKV